MDISGEEMMVEEWDNWRSFSFEDGDILFVRNRRSLLGRVIRNALSDFDYEHVCQWFNGQVYTTGASGFPLYRFGKVSPEEYFKNKSITVGRYEGLSKTETDVMQNVAESLIGNAYPWWKLVALMVQGKLSSRVIKKVGFKNNRSPRFVFCAAAVAMGILSAGLPVTHKYAKTEPDAYTPRTLYDSSLIKIMARFQCDT